MSTKVLAYFGSTETAATANTLLEDAGFSGSNIVQKSYLEGATETDNYVQSLMLGQSLILITVSGNVEEQKAIDILVDNDALKIYEIVIRLPSGKAIVHHRDVSKWKFRFGPQN